MEWLVAYTATLAVFLAVDAAWIYLVVRKLYDFETSDIIRPKPRLGAATMFYVVYAAGVTMFSTLPLTHHFNGMHATMATYIDVALWGAALGFFAYSTFAFTNQAVIRGWNYKLVIMDLAWGTLLTSAVALVGFAAFRAII